MERSLRGGKDPVSGQGYQNRACFRLEGCQVSFSGPRGCTTETFKLERAALAHYRQCVQDFRERHPGVEWLDDGPNTIEFWRVDG
jgi:hypothetical protein